MKNFVTTLLLPHSARFARLSSNFKMNVSIVKDVVSLDFIDEERLGEHTDMEEKGDDEK